MSAKCTDADWCTCEPYGDQTCEYRDVADRVIDLLNPPDSDEAESSLVTGAIERAVAFITSQPCTCPDVEFFEEDACGRCDALGQWHGKRYDR
jgi:hypothetical protein